MSGLSFLLADIDEPERRSRVREMRALAVIFLGWRHPATLALGDAITDPAAGEHALALVAAAPALRRRKLLSAYAALMTPTAHDRH